jgi:hypothetical protein
MTAAAANTLPMVALYHYSPRSVRRPRRVQAPSDLTLAQALLDQADGDRDELAGRLGGASHLEDPPASIGKPRIAKLDAACLDGGERHFRAPRDLFALVLGDGGEDVDCQPGRMRIVARDEVDARFHEVRGERNALVCSIQRAREPSPTSHHAVAHFLARRRPTWAIPSPTPGTPSPVWAISSPTRATTHPRHRLALAPRSARIANLRIPSRGRCQRRPLR